MIAVLVSVSMFEPYLVEIGELCSPVVFDPSGFYISFSCLLQAFLDTKRRTQWKLPIWALYLMLGYGSLYLLHQLLLGSLFDDYWARLRSMSI